MKSYFLFLSIVLSNLEGLNSCLSGGITNQTEAEVKSFITGIGGLSNSSVVMNTSANEISGMMTKARILGEEGKSEQKIKDSISSDIQIILDKSPDIGKSKNSFVRSIDVLIKKNTSTSSTEQVNVCKDATWKINNRVMKFTQIQGLHADGTAANVLTKIEPALLHCIPSSQIRVISSKSLKLYARNLIPMAIELNQSLLNLLLTKSNSYTQNLQKAKTLRTKISNDLITVTNSLRLFINLRRTNYYVYCRTKNNLTFNHITDVNTKEREAFYVYESNLKELSENIEKFYHVCPTFGGKDDIQNYIKTLPTDISDISNFNDYQVGSECETQFTSDVKKVSTDMSTFENSSSREIIKLLDDVLANFDTEIARNENEISKLQKLINELNS